MGKLWDLIQKHIDEAPYPPSRRQLAVRLGVTPTTFERWRDLKQLPSRENLEAIAALVGVRYSVVLDAALHDTGYHESAEVVPLGSRRPVKEIEAELELARQDLEEFDQLRLTERGRSAKRKELQSRVEALEAQLDAARPTVIPVKTVSKS